VNKLRSVVSHRLLLFLHGRSHIFGDLADANVTGQITPDIIDAMTDASQSLLWVSTVNAQPPSQAENVADRRLIRSQALRYYHRQQRKVQLAVRPRQQEGRKKQKVNAGSDPISATPRHQRSLCRASSTTDSAFSDVAASERAVDDYETVRLQHSTLTRDINNDPFDSLPLPSTPHIYRLLYHCTCAASLLLDGVQLRQQPRIALFHISPLSH
jgi:hypothetical protein